MTQNDEMEERLAWLSAEVYQLIYQRIRDMKFPTTGTGECVFCGQVGTPDGVGHDQDCLAAEAAKATDDQVEES